MESEDVEALQVLLESVPQVAGYPPGPSDALSSVIGRLEGVPSNYKDGFGLCAEGELVAFADVLRGYLTADVAYIGLLIVRGDSHGSGFGSRLHSAILREAAGWHGIKTLRTGITNTNKPYFEWFWIARVQTHRRNKTLQLPGTRFRASRDPVRSNSKRLDGWRTLPSG